MATGDADDAHAPAGPLGHAWRRPMGSHAAGAGDVEAVVCVLRSYAHVPRQRTVAPRCGWSAFAGLLGVSFASAEGGLRFVEAPERDVPMDLQQRMGVDWETLGAAVREGRVQPVESYATEALASGDSHYRVVQRSLEEYIFKQARSSSCSSDAPSALAL